jgi:hypothetical protein
MKTSTVTAIKKLGLNPVDFSTDSSVSLKGRTVLGNPKTFGQDKNLCLFRAQDGFGCDPQSRGSCIFVTRLSDGKEGRIERYDTIAVRTLEADLVDADIKLGQARSKRDQGQKEHGRDAIPAYHPLIKDYNTAMAYYEYIRSAIAYKAAVDAGEVPQPTNG